jgi:hypothetical protein
VKFLIRRHLLFQLVEKPDELLGAMARKATRNHLTVEDIERGEQIRVSAVRHESAAHPSGDLRSPFRE